MRVRIVASTLLLLCGPGRLTAQLCVGNASFPLSHFTTAANFEFDPVAQRYTLEARYNTHHFFAAAEYGVRSWETTSLNGLSQAYSLSLGMDGSSPKSKIGFCPMVRWSGLSGPNEIAGTAWNFSERVIAGGLSLGFLMARSRLWDFMPTANITFGTGNPQLTTPAGGSLDEYQDFCCGERGFTTFRLGIGLGYSDELTLIPSITWPLDNGGSTQKGAQKTYAVRATLRLGKGI
jgi:hypothetical protein